MQRQKNLQDAIDKEISNREIFQREYDLRKDAVIFSQKKSIVLFKKIDEIIDLLKDKKVDDADLKLNKEMYNYFWNNVLFFSSELQIIYKNITDLAIEAILIGPDKYKEYFDKIKEMKGLYFEYIQIFRKTYYYSDLDFSKYKKKD